MRTSLRSSGNALCVGGRKFETWIGGLGGGVLYEHLKSSGFDLIFISKKKKKRILVGLVGFS